MTMTMKRFLSCSIFVYMLCTYVLLVCTIRSTSLANGNEIQQQNANGITDHFQLYKQVKRRSPKTCGEQSEETVRAVIANLLTDAEVNWLKELIERGMAGVTDQRGPTIMDPDLGLVLARGGKVQRIHTKFTDAELSRYADLLKRVHTKVCEIHGIDKMRLYHTAPTFIARIAPFPEDEKTQHVHDEYWHLHCDKNNTDHYDYSALVYLADYGKDFEGGEFQFEDEDEGGKAVTEQVLPSKGSLITFSSGIENPHRVSVVTKGVRLAWSLWFTCDPSKRFRESRLRLDEEEASGDSKTEL